LRGKLERPNKSVKEIKRTFNYESAFVCDLD
jgi:hypothetical protein